MTNVLTFRPRPPRQSTDDRLALHLDCFANARRNIDDVFWMKEVAELLNILEATGQSLGPAALGPLESFYAGIERRMGFFPQYYRFLLSIAQDLEALGLPGEKSHSLVEWALHQRLAEAELSDLQRGEARRLMLRSGIDPMAADRGLDDRLRAFTARTATFALPNKKAAYELTHTVFYLSEYGRRDPRLPEATLTSLTFAGTLAFLDQNADLLAEVCIALRYAGQTPPALWEAWIAEEVRLYSLIETEIAPLSDDYHEYFVANWAMAVAGKPIFEADMPKGRVVFHAATGRAPVLRELSEALFALEGPRSAEWPLLRGLLAPQLSDGSQEVLNAAERALPGFETFVEGFVRASQPGLAS